MCDYMLNRLIRIKRANKHVYIVINKKSGCKTYNIVYVQPFHVSIYRYMEARRSLRECVPEAITS